MKLPSFFSSPLRLTHRERIDKYAHTLTQAIQLKENKDDVSKKTLKLISHIFNRQGSAAPKTASHVSTPVPASDEAASNGITASSTTSFVDLRAKLQEGLDALNTTEMGTKSFAKIESRLYFLAGTAEGAKAEWEKLYWGTFDSRLSVDEQVGEAGLAVACLGYVPDPSTMPASVNTMDLFDAFAIMADTEETSLPDEALATLDALFQRTYGLPFSLDPADYATYTDLPDPSNDGFRSIPTAQIDLDDIQKGIETLPPGPIRRALQARVDDFFARTQTAFDYFMGEAKKPVDAENPDDVQRQSVAHAWLGHTAIEDGTDLTSNHSDAASEASSEAANPSTTPALNTEADDVGSIGADTILSSWSSQPDLIKRVATDPSTSSELDNVLKSRVPYASTSKAGGHSPLHRTESEHSFDEVGQDGPDAQPFEKPEDAELIGMEGIRWNANRNDEVDAGRSASKSSVRSWLDRQSDAELPHDAGHPFDTGLRGSDTYEADQSEPHSRSSSLAGFDLPFTYDLKDGGVYFGSSSGIINTRTMSLEQAFFTKRNNRAVSDTTLAKLDKIFERTSGIVLDRVHTPPQLSRARFGDAYDKRFQNLKLASEELARITLQVEQMPSGPAQEQLRVAVARYNEHITEAQHWWEARLEHLTSNPPPAERTELQHTHELKTTEALTWLGGLKQAR